MVARAQRKRALPSKGGSGGELGDGEVEGRDMDDWMVVDCGNIIVSVMDAEAREVFALEGMYESMELGKDPYAGMTYEEWLAVNPIPEKWLQRLERDEVELEEAQRVVKGRSAGVVGGGAGVAANRGAAASNSHHFSRKLTKNHRI